MYVEGEQVLVILPLIEKSLLAKYIGPYVIEKRLGVVDYVVRTPTDVHVSRGESFMSILLRSTLLETQIMLLRLLW